MKENKSFYTASLLVVICIFCLCFIGQKVFDASRENAGQGDIVMGTNFGSFLAAQHALHVNDFDNAQKLMTDVKSDVGVVKNVKNAVDFFAGKMPDDASTLKTSKDLVERLIYDADLIARDDWKGVYERHKNDDNILYAPTRIFSGVTQSKTKDVIKYIDSLQINDMWRAFLRGQVAVLNNDIDAAAQEFARVHPDFMNINDYLYLMSFYQKNGMVEDMQILKDDFVAKSGGMYIVDYPEIPDWMDNYDGVKNHLAFGIIQTISHSQVMIYTDLSLAFLRFAQIVSGGANANAINYYLGQYYAYNSGDYEKCFNDIEPQSPLYLFGQLKIAEKTGNITAIENIARKNPLFVPAVNLAVRDNIRRGDKRGALKIINRGLRNKKITDEARAYFLKQRVHVNLMFDNVTAAQNDIIEVKTLGAKITPDVMLLQARIWEKQNRNLDEAYNHAMALIKMNASDINAWDVLSLIVDKKEGAYNAIEMLEKITTSGAAASNVYEHLGDLYLKLGDRDGARRAYGDALNMQGDGLIVAPLVQKKLRKLK